MELIDTIGDMISTDYKKRFIAEYHQLNIRINKLLLIIEKYNDGELEFELSVPISLLVDQVVAMQVYRSKLLIRADLEGITLY